MRKTYKNKRDYYKREAGLWKEKTLLAEDRIRRLNDQLETFRKPVKEDRINVAWFCPTCRAVVKGTTVRGSNSDGIACFNCGTKGVMLVSKLPQYFE